MHVLVSVPPAANVTGLGAHETVRPVPGEVEEVIVTGPAKPSEVPPRLVNVRILVPVDPEVNVTVVGAAVIEKSLVDGEVTVVVNVNVLERSPLATFTVTV